jgi:oligopeptide transport system permease protein
VIRTIAVRLAEALLTLWLLVTLTFVLLRAAPGGPFDLERDVPPEIAANLAARFHLDEPLPVQYLRYLGQIARGDLGPSFQYPDFTVDELVRQGLPVSLLTGSLALALALMFGTLLGAWAGWRAGSAGDRAVTLAAALGVSIPKFVAAPILILVFAVWLGWLPAGGWGEWRHVVLPVAALALPSLAVVARLMRASTIEVLASDYVRAARARGIEGWDLFLRHVLRPAFSPVLAWIAPAMIAVLTGSTVVEQVFGIRGIGRYFVQGALNRDYTLVLGVALVAGVLIVIVNLVVDGLRLWLDPRLRER